MRFVGDGFEAEPVSSPCGGFGAAGIADNDGVEAVESFEELGGFAGA